MTDHKTPANYDAAYFTNTYGADGLKPFSSHWWPVRWYASLAERCLEANGGTRLLEIGCGPGFILARLEKRYATFGVDLSPWAIEQAARFAPGSQCFAADVEQGLPTAIADGGFDVILAKYVFEHLHDPLAVLRTAHGLLRPGGTLLYSVPYTHSLGARRKGEEWFAAKDPTHASLWPRNEWQRVTRQAGFVIERESADGWWDVPYFAGLPAALQLPLFIGPTALAILSGRALLPATWGENLLFICRRP